MVELVGVEPMTYTKMVELVGVEPMTYTMRTYRSSQLSYSPIDSMAGFPATSLKIAVFWRKSRRILKKYDKN